MTALFLAYSGGIDSTALALLCPEGQTVFTDTGWEFPALYQFLDRFEAQTGRAVVRLQAPYPGGLPGRIRDKLFFPSFNARYCTREFKIEPLNQFLRAHLPCTMAIGLRADEQRVGNLTQMDGLTITYPLQEQGLDRAACVALCVAHDLLPRYPPYMLRGGCIGCFFKRPSEVQALLALEPALYDGLQALEEEVQDERGRFYHLFRSVGMPLRDFRKQPLLLAPDQVYGATGPEPTPCGVLCHR